VIRYPKVLRLAVRLSPWLPKRPVAWLASRRELVLFIFSFLFDQAGRLGGQRLG